jgi:hypothetical protein
MNDGDEPRAVNAVSGNTYQAQATAAAQSGATGPMRVPVSGLVRQLFGNRSEVSEKGSVEGSVRAEPAPSQSSTGPRASGSSSIRTSESPAVHSLASGALVARVSGTAKLLGIVGGLVAATALVAQTGTIPTLAVGLGWVPVWAHGPTLLAQLRAGLSGHTIGGFSIGLGP